MSRIGFPAVFLGGRCMRAATASAGAGRRARSPVRPLPHAAHPCGGVATMTYLLLTDPADVESEFRGAARAAAVDRRSARRAARRRDAA
ncbi:protein of unknown function [Burkholderia multivorans]